MYVITFMLFCLAVGSVLYINWELIKEEWEGSSVSTSILREEARDRTLEKVSILKEIKEGRLVDEDSARD